MKIKQMFLILIAIFGLLILSCGNYDTGYATITVYNQSDNDVTDILIPVVGVDAAGKIPSLSLLEKGKSHKFNAEWLGASITGSFLYIIEYHINGDKFGIEHQEDAKWIDYDDGDDRFVSPQTIKNGAVAEIFIKNEGYKFVVHKGKVAWSDDDYIIHPPPVPGK